MSSKKYCGNCGWHNVYEYPNIIFCELKLKKFPTLTPGCENWMEGYEECFCVRDALESERKAKTKLVESQR